MERLTCALSLLQADRQVDPMVCIFASPALVGYPDHQNTSKSWTY